MRERKNKGRIKCCCSSLCKIAIILSTPTAFAITLPSPELPYGNDSVRTPDGFSCSTAIAPSSYVDFGVYQDDSNIYDKSDKGVYARVLIPFYSNKTKRLDCSKLYEEQLKKMKLENSLDNLKKDIFK